MPVLVANRGAEWYYDRYIIINNALSANENPRRPTGIFETLEDYIESLEIDKQYLDEDIRQRDSIIEELNQRIDELNGEIQMQAQTPFAQENEQSSISRSPESAFTVAFTEGGSILPLDP